MASRTREIGKALEDLNELAKKWQHEDAHFRSKESVDKARL